MVRAPRAAAQPDRPARLEVPLRFSDLLVALELISRHDVDHALERQSRTGRPLGEVVVEMGLLSAHQVRELQEGLPAPPDTLAQLGIDSRIVFDMLVKFLSNAGHGTTASIAETLAISRRLSAALIEQARAQGIVELKPGIVAGELRVELTPRGRSMAVDAFSANAYIGPLPVSLEEYSARVLRQSIRSETITAAAVAQAMQPLMVEEELLAKVGIAINAGRSILLYGAAGNGKTSIAERMVRTFGAMVLIPHCFEVAGQIVKVYDPAVHKRLGVAPGRKSTASLFADEFDPRWVPCRRPFVAAGGELSLDMLDLKFEETSRFYEAPLHVKAMNGVLLIDDFGRQLVRPEALLNRWVVPMDRRIDFLKLHTGQSFQIPFDQLLVFSTNLSPSDLMDPAFLRRLPYKIHVHGPTVEQFAKLLLVQAARRGVEFPERAVVQVIEEIRQHGTPLAYYQAAEIPEQIADFCAFLGRPPVADDTTIRFALGNVLVD
jgi:predicted ATPase with chaperone activity